jgi:glutamate formiminotransferase/glutamate formiminotransferase/formiminotetrahydrofolate cyclodeaminase
VQAPPLLAVPNVSEGSDPETIDAIAGAFAAAGARVLDVHSDGDHERSVYSLADAPGQLASALLAGAREAVARIDINQARGQHPYVGAVDVVPIVHLDATARGSACAEALVVADLLASELELPVFLYGALGGGRTRAQLRRGGPAELERRIAAGELEPDFGPPRLHATAGATLVSARPPLVAFNLELAPPATGETARRVAAAIREGGPDGLPGVRAIGLELPSRGGRAQVSLNVEDPVAAPLGAVVAAVSEHAEVSAAELVGLAPRAAVETLPAGLPLRSFDPARQIIENALGL